MMDKVYRLYSSKRDEFATEADALCTDIINTLGVKGLHKVKIYNRYDVQGIDAKVIDKIKGIIFSEPMVDDLFEQLPKEGDRILAVEYLPGQFDQRADSCEQCIQIYTTGLRPKVKSAKVYVFYGDISDLEYDKICDYLINPVEAKKASMDMPKTLEEKFEIPKTVETVVGFTELNKNELSEFLKEYALAMDIDDILFLQQYFKNEEKRDPTITEIRMIDTYWSDHCRHTTFLTQIDKVEINCDYIKKDYEKYLKLREDVYKDRITDKPICLMDIATIAAKYLKKKGVLKNLDESEEINACSIKITVDVCGKDEEYLLMFKNETHNHPTEIEPFGGAATCLGGAIRDPLSGRSYVYQAMRVTGASDPTVDNSQTLKGKLPQKKIVTTAAAGYSSYGNQIGLATGLVNEIYHSGYVAKRLEIGFVVGAVKAENVIREVPQKGDVVILLGGATGRDGCGGATGSSKSHTLESIETCGAEVQKGNPPEERKIQRLFRNKEVTRMIIRCNDFGAGGVSVAIGELADGLIIDLNKIPKKYEGLSGTELAISESQERMAVVVKKENVQKFIDKAKEENLNACEVAYVTDTNRLQMMFYDKMIVDISRDFLNSNGAVKHADIKIEEPCVDEIYKGVNDKNSFKDICVKTVSDLNMCSQKGLVERFDSTIGASSVLMPYGGKYQLSPTQIMAAKIPCESETNTCSVASYGFNPFVSETSPYHGAQAAVVESVAKLVAAGCKLNEAYLTFQEYFERLKNDPIRWGKPFSALLGAVKAQTELKIAAIGGKDSMSGTFENIDVPPTLVSFAIAPSKADKVIQNHFEKAGSNVYLLMPEYDENNVVNYDSLLNVFDKIEKLCDENKVLSSFALTMGGCLEAVFKMAIGNKIGFEFEALELDITKPVYGAVLIETDCKLDEILIGRTVEKECITYKNESVELNELINIWEDKLEKVFPTKVKETKTARNYSYNKTKDSYPKIKTQKPKVFIPVFPGTNCEYDTKMAFEKAGAECDILIIKNLDSNAIEQSVKEAKKLIDNSNIIMLPGGFSGGDEPEGSGKFIATFFRNPILSDAVMELIKKRDGLMLGICNGFQALIKLGLVPFGEIRGLTKDDPTLTFNSIGRHQSMMVNTKIASNLSPWLKYCNTGDIHTIAISHGEGRFVCDEDILKALAQNGQIATQYVDFDKNASMDIRFNPNGSVDAIEGITSPDGRIFGKMGHSERTGENICKNVPGNKDQMLFKAGVDYFKI